MPRERSTETQYHNKNKLSLLLAAPKLASNKSKFEIDAFVGKRSLIINLNMGITTNHIVSREQKKQHLCRY